MTAMPSTLHAHRRFRRAAGFTLIELMITVAIVAVLMAIAVESYDFAMVKTRRGAAKGCLLQDAQYMERFYTTNFAYDKDTGGNDVELPGCSSDVDDYYEVSLQSTATKTYKLQAIPQGHQATADAKCGTLTVNQAGQKTVSGTAAVSDCW